MTDALHATSVVPPQAVLLGMANAFLISRALQVAAELGIADSIGAEGASVDELVGLTGCDGPSLYRLLRMLASHGIFSEDHDGRFRSTELSEPLRSESRGSVRDTIRIVDRDVWNAFGALEHSIATGQSAFKFVFGRTFFEHHDIDSAANARFAQGMAKLSESEDPLVPQFYDFTPYRTVVDVGGGRGGLIAEILKANPGARGVLYDRAAVVSEPVVASAGVADRCAIESGNFFDAVPAGGDVYVVKRILHDWPDDPCVQLLRNCASAVPRDGRVLVIDAVVPEGNTEHPSKDVDLLMLALLGGKERTAEQFQGLCDRAGLRMTRIIPIPALVSIIECELVL
jgi:hypothetical protein